MIDLHTHTNESDGTFSPAELVAEARRVGVTTLAITDHDTLSGYDLAAPHAAGHTNVICGVELSTKLHGQSVHLLGYFPRLPSHDFREWIFELQATRRERNLKLLDKLRALGVEITLEEVQAEGRAMIGRPHFARVLLQKGYVTNLQQAFEEYLSKAGKAYVERFEPPFADCVARIQAAGGVSSMAHPIRWNGDLAALMPTLRSAKLDALEAHHSDHTPQDVERFRALAAAYGMAITGGSDFHGANKPGISLGTGRDENVSVPESVLQLFKSKNQ